jgi:hypothetical protein
MKLNKILYTTFYETCVVSSSKNYVNENLMYVWGKSNQATNIKRNRDDNNDNSKENKQ